MENLSSGLSHIYVTYETSRIVVTAEGDEEKSRMFTDISEEFDIEKVLS